MLPRLLGYALPTALHAGPARSAALFAAPGAGAGRLLAPEALVARWFGSRRAGERQAVALREEDLEESFVKGSGKGGQKINKVRNCVLLKHRPSGLLVRCQKTRSLDDNRRVARKLLLQKLDDLVNGELSARSAKIDRLRKKKRGRRARAKDKYAPRAEADGVDSDDDEDEDEDVDDEDVDDEDDEEQGERSQ